MKLIRGTEGYFLSMQPTKKPDGGFQDTVAPLDREAEEMIEDAVLKE